MCEDGLWRPEAEPEAQAAGEGCSQNCGREVGRSGRLGQSRQESLIDGGGVMWGAHERAVTMNVCAGRCLISALCTSPHFAFRLPWEVGPSAVAPVAEAAAPRVLFTTHHHSPAQGTPETCIQEVICRPWCPGFPRSVGDGENSQKTEAWGGRGVVGGNQGRCLRH